MLLRLHMQVAIPEPMAVSTDVLQSSKEVTGSFVVLVVMSKLIVMTANAYPVKYKGEVLTPSIEMAGAMEALYQELVRRYMSPGPSADIVEDWVVTTMLDSRYELPLMMAICETQYICLLSCRYARCKISQSRSYI